MRKTIGLLLIAVGAIACAKIEVKKTSDALYDGGVRFYRSQLYLLVTSDGSGKAQTVVVSLPTRIRSMSCGQPRGWKRRAEGYAGRRVEPYVYWDHSRYKNS